MDHDPLVESVGTLAMAFSKLDFRLNAILAELLETDIETTLIIAAALEHRKKHQLLSSLAEGKLAGDKDLLKRFTQFLADCKGMAKERNYAVHSLWSKGLNGGVMRYSLTNVGIFKVDIKRRAPGHMISKAQQTNELGLKAADLGKEIRRCVQTWRKTHPPTSWIRLENAQPLAEASPHKPEDPY